MRFKRQQNSGLPTVNLVPMMDVLMTVLTFFIIISMSLTGQKIAGVNLPTIENDAANSVAAEKLLIVGLNQQGEILLDQKSVSQDELIQRIQTHLTQNSESIIVLKADRQLPYDQVTQLLTRMRDIGGNRVSLAVEQN